jgi:hypothetical protein
MAKRKPGRKLPKGKNIPQPPTTNCPPETSSPLPKPKTKNVAPQPPQSYRDPATYESDDMSGSENNSLIIPSTASSQESSLVINEILRPSNSSQDYFAGLRNSQADQDMITDDFPDNQSQKRKRTNTNPDELDSPASQRSFTGLPPNQLGISLNSPTIPQEPRLPHIQLGANISTTALRNNPTASSSPRYSSHSPLLYQDPNTPGRLPSPNIKDLDVTGFLGDNTLIGIDPKSISTWRNIQGFKALVYPHDAAFSDNDKVKIGAQMSQAVTFFLNVNGPVVTAPKAADSFLNRKAENRRPWCYLISQLSEEDLDTITNEGFIANQHAVLHVIPFSPNPSHYIGRIKNLTLEPTHHKSVTKLIQDSIREDASTMKFITDFISTHHDFLPQAVFRSGTAVKWVVNSVKAYHIQKDGEVGVENSQWKWYIYTPTSTVELVDKWIKTLAKVTFDAKIYGVGETITDTKCPRCKSTNHSTLECPFTNRSQFTPPLPTNRPPTNARGGRGGKRGASSSRGRN